MILYQYQTDATFTSPSLLQKLPSRESRQSSRFRSHLTDFSAQAQKIKKKKKKKKENLQKISYISGN